MKLGVSEENPIPENPHCRFPVFHLDTPAFQLQDFPVWFIPSQAVIQGFVFQQLRRSQET